MEKYIILIIIIIIIYYIHKYCIQLEVTKILNTKNNIAKFTNVNETPAQQKETPAQQKETPAQQEQALLEIQSKIKESMKAFYALITQFKDKPEVEKNLITKNSIENFTDTIGVGTDMIGPSINKRYTNNILYSPEIEEIIQKFRALVYTVSRLPQTNQTIDAFYKLGTEVLALSETRAVVNNLRTLLSKVKVNLPKSLNSISQELTQFIYITLDRLLTQINELLLVYSNTSVGKQNITVSNSVIATGIPVNSLLSRDAIITIVNKVTQGLGLSNDIVELIKNEALNLSPRHIRYNGILSDELKTRLKYIVGSTAQQYTLLKSKHIKEMGELVASYAVANVISSPIETLEQSLVVATTTQSIIIQAHKYIQDSLEIATTIAVNSVNSGQASTLAQLFVGAAMNGTLLISEVTRMSQDSRQRSLSEEEAQRELYYLTLSLLKPIEPNLRFIQSNKHKERFEGDSTEVEKIRNVFKQTIKNYVDQGYPEIGLIVGQAAAQRELATIIGTSTDVVRNKSIIYKRQIIDVIEKSPKESYNQEQRDAINRKLVQLQAELQVALVQQKQI
jgi:hypothetical protein